MKNHLILTLMSVLFFSILGHGQSVDENLKLKSNTLDQEVEHLTMPLSLDFKLKTNTLVYYGDSDVRLVQPEQQGSQFAFLENNSNQLTPLKVTDAYSFYNPSLGYTTVIEKGKKIKGAKLSGAVSHGLNFWLKSN